MSSNAITTVIKMMESFSEDTQNRIVEHLREYILELEDEQKWDETFAKTQSQLSAAAKRARQEISEGHSIPMDYDKL
ncbi:hypothetical protein NIES4071_28430 [Calothrix sp. NIES-4071]|nr:hypothetical protein NIES4071_28430 [Calothrix sp. NIES-4071]BAZ57165.1 hypothetical protein NIES4105_28370 [Calothrix sp. NIES-4105]